MCSTWNAVPSVDFSSVYVANNKVSEVVCVVCVCVCASACASCDTSKTRLRVDSPSCHHDCHAQCKDHWSTNLIPAISLTAPLRVLAVSRTLLLAKTDTAKSINAKLGAGLHVVMAPGVCELRAPNAAS